MTDKLKPIDKKPANVIVPPLTDDEQRSQRENELVNRFFTIKEPEPVVDQAKLDRLKRMGRINGLGKGLSVLSDALSVGIGGNVQRRQPDQVTPALFQSYQNTLDKYKDEKTAYDNRDFQNERQNILFGLQRLDKESAEAFKKRVQEAQQKYDYDKLAADTAKYNKDYQLKVEGHNLDVAKANNDDKHKSISEQIAFAKLQTEQEKANATSNKPFMYAGVDGKDVPLSQGQFRAYLEAASKDPNFDDFKAGMEEFVNNPLEGQKQIVQRYLSYLNKQAKDEKANKQASIEAKKIVDGLKNNNPLSTFTDKKPVQQKQTPAISKTEAKSKWSKYARSSK